MSLMVGRTGSNFNPENNVLRKSIREILRILLLGLEIINQKNKGGEIMKKEEIRKWLAEYKSHTGCEATFCNKDKTITLIRRHVKIPDTYSLKKGLIAIKIITGYI
jgi:hypothetical protein